MSSSHAPTTPTTETGSKRDHERELDTAARFAAARKAGTTDAPPSEFDFLNKLSFFVTIGYLTKDQATALFEWFHSSGMKKLPPLEGPAGVQPPTMYEILSTAIHFGTPREVLEGQDLSGADIGDFFSGLAHAVGDLVGGVLDDVSGVLDSATALLQAASQLVHEVHDAVVLAP
jgi:hypothetical protein